MTNFRHCGANAGTHQSETQVILRLVPAYCTVGLDMSSVVQYGVDPDNPSAIWLDLTRNQLTVRRPAGVLLTAAGAAGVTRAS